MNISNTMLGVAAALGISIPPNPNEGIRNIQPHGGSFGKPKPMTNRRALQNCRRYKRLHNYRPRLNVR